MRKNIYEHKNARHNCNKQTEINFIKTIETVAPNTFHGTATVVFYFGFN